ncbi:ABC transporter substrate-binding protein [Streptomyces sp.]|uniref:ABC transporter substrate-binding protein n=1 Tax=Streptomyces sp. TaxID=1931 RepID=UPI002F41DB24
MFTSRSIVLATAAAAMGSLLLAGCGGGSGSGSASDGKTLRLWHFEAPDSAMGVAWQEAIKEFKASHPGVTVEFEAKGFEQIQKTAPMVLNSDAAPDVMEYNKGNATTGLLSKQGLLTDLAPVAQQKGWDKALAPSLKTTATYDDRGVMGSGKWYGVPNYGEFTTVYYNNDLFRKYGIQVPKTFDEFIAALDAFKKKGVTPLANAGAEYPASHYLYQLALSKADQSWVDAYQRYTGEVDFHDAAWTYAAQTFSDWVKKGYIAKTSSGLKAEDAGTQFSSGKYPIFFSGSWWFGRFQQQAKFDWGTFPWPGSTKTLGSSGNLWVVPKNAKNKQLAYDFIDITMKSRIQQVLAGAGGLPAVSGVRASDPKTLAFINQFDAQTAKNGLGFYPDWPAAGLYDVLVSQTQKLINGSSSPDKVLSALQRAYDDGVPAK